VEQLIEEVRNRVERTPADALTRSMRDAIPTATSARMPTSASDNNGTCDRSRRVGLPSTAPSDASEEDVSFMLDGLLDEIEDEDLTEVFSEFLIPADE